VKLAGGAIVAKALADEGIRWTFGIPGTHNIELYDALADSPVRPILVTDEQSASFMADAVWRASGTLGCVNVVPGAGLTHALSGIAEAWMDGVAMLVLACGIRRDTGKAYQLHDVDQLAIARPVTKGQFLVRDGADLYRTIRDACALARQGTPGPAIVEVPVELYLFPQDFPDAQSPSRRAIEATDPPAADVERVAAMLNAPGVRPLLYVGAGAAGAGDALVRLAERLDAPVATTIHGKGVFPESHPLFLWNGFGAAAPAFAQAVAKARSATLAIGCRFSEVGTGSYGVQPPQPLVHVDIDPAVPNRNYPAAVAVTADAARFVERLLPLLAPRAPDAGVRSAIKEGHAAVWREWLGKAGGDRVAPARLLTALQEAFGPETIYTTDSGNGTFLAMEMLRLDGPRRFLAPVDYSCMGYAVPAALGAKLARPDAPVIALAGDGALLMTGLELLTAAQQGIAVAVVVLRDGELAQIAQFQRTALSRETASALPDFDVATVARGLGVEALQLARDGDIAAVLARAREVLAAGRPVVIDVAIDYSRPTYFTRGVVRANLLRLPWRDRLRFVARAIGRKLPFTGSRPAGSC
jgi:acetolactate synthase-1/2/3 large subunit